MTSVLMDRPVEAKVPGAVVIDAESSDEALLDAAGNGDSEAFAELYRRYRPHAYAYALGLRVTPAEAEDAVAEAFLQIYQALVTRHRAITSFGGYLTISVRHNIYRRHRTATRQHLTATLDDLDRPAEYADPVADSFERTTLASALRLLPARSQLVLSYLLVEELSLAEAGGRLGLSPNATAALGLRSRERLRQAYLQAHLTQKQEAGCRQYARLLGAWTRGGIPPWEARRVSDHVDRCRTCAAAARELAEVNFALRPTRPPRRSAA